MSKGYKGGEFEREVCKALSVWWTKDLPGGARDDVFWRSSQSGGRATQRMKSGKTTFGSYGDIAFVDPIGAPLLELFTIELKRGSSHSHPGDLIDFKPENEKHISSQCLAQAYRSHRDAGSYAWMMIGRRDHRVAVCYIDQSRNILREETGAFARANCVRFNLRVRRKNASPLPLKFVALPLESFLARVSPAQIMQCLKNLRKT